MEIILDNILWMSFNVFLAFLGVIFGFLLYYSKNKLLKWLFFILWILFIPNTIYLTTDLQHLPGQLIKLEFINQSIVTIQFIIIFVLGITTFLFALYPFQRALFQLTNKSNVNIILFFINYSIAFGVFLGKFYRVHSWYVFTDPQNVITSSIHLLNSSNILFLVFLFGSIINIIYFLLNSKLKFMTSKNKLNFLNKKLKIK